MNLELAGVWRDPLDNRERYELENWVCKRDGYKTMSELGNRVRSLRADVSQMQFAARTGLSLRTICKLEAGESVRLTTVRQVAQSLNLSEMERLELIVLWLKLELGDDFRKLNVELKDGSAVLRESDDLLGKVQVLLHDIPQKHQEQVYLAVQRPEVLRCVQSLNDLYDSVKATSEI